MECRTVFHHLLACQYVGVKNLPDLTVHACTFDPVLNEVIASLAIAVPGCQPEPTSLETLDVNQLSTGALVFIDMNLEDADACSRMEVVLQRWREQIARGVVRCILIGDAGTGGASSIDQQSRLFQAGLYEIMERPLNLRRLRYLMETSRLEIRHILAKLERVETTQLSNPSALRQKLSKVARVDTPVLITGETGVGKTYWAEQIHRQSPRSGHPFVVVNCANLSTELAESLLFGHVKGSFTGAEQSHIGFLETAGEGTVFLDEIDCLPQAVQAKLLRAVEKREFHPLGANAPRLFQGRILTASNQDLEQLVTAGQFRSDLYYRINVFAIEILPLRRRLAEFGEFCRMFVEVVARNLNVPRLSLEPGLVERLARYPWPGNLRELRNAIEYAAIDCEGDGIRADSLPPTIAHFLRQAAATRSPIALSDKHGSHYQDNRRGSRAVGEGTSCIKAAQLVGALQKNGFNRSRAARELGVSRMTLYNWLNEFGIC